VIVRAIAEHELLAVWDEALAQHPLDRALTLLTALEPMAPRAELRALSVGERDRRLIELREQLFGPQLKATATCPRCTEALELSAPLAELRASLGAADATNEPEQWLEVDDLMVRFRRVTSRDLAAIVAAPDAEAARAALFARVFIEARPRGSDQPLATPALPAGAVAAVEARLAELEAAADINFELECPQCRAAWSAPFDPCAYLWTEIDVWARRLLRSVDTLARVYGWREADVLALSPHRRRFYLEMAEG
jgi:hypothetical protein